MINFELKQIYSFDVYPVPLLGNNFKNVTVLAIMDQESANQLIDTQALHISVYPYLPAGTPNSPAQYNYVKIRTTSGETTVLGLAWINEATVQMVNAQTIHAKIGNVSAADVAKVRNCLLQNGFKDLVITVE